MTKRATATTPAQADLLGATAPLHPKPQPAARTKVAEKPAPKPTKPKPKPVSTAVAKPAPQANVVPLRQTPTNMLMVIAQAASDPKVDPAKMRELLNIQKDIMAEEARIEFINDFIALQKEMPYINRDNKIEILGKDGTPKAGKVIQSTPYATFPNIHRLTKPVLEKHGFAMNFPAKPNAAGDRLIVVGTLMHRRGHVVTTEFPLPAETSGSKNNVQGWGSSFQYGRRYGAIGLLNIVSDAKQDQDRDGFGDNAKVVDARPTIDSDQLETLTDQVEASVGVKRFCEKYEIEAIKDLPAAMFDEAVLACQAFATQKKQRGHG